MDFSVSKRRKVDQCGELGEHLHSGALTGSYGQSASTARTNSRPLWRRTQTAISGSKARSLAQLATPRSVDGVGILVEDDGDPEPNTYRHVFSPFHRNTLLIDARRLHESGFGEQSGLFGLFYTRAGEDPKTVEALPERYSAADIAK